MKPNKKNLWQITPRHPPPPILLQNLVFGCLFSVHRCFLVLRSMVLRFFCFCVVFPDGFGGVEVEGPWAAAPSIFFTLQLRTTLPRLEALSPLDRKGASLPSLCIEEIYSPFCMETERVSLFYVERRETPSLSRGEERVSLSLYIYIKRRETRPRSRGENVSRYKKDTHSL